MTRHEAALWSCVWACAWACASGVWLDNGSYEDLVLAIDPNMEMETLNITQLQQNIEDLITDMGDGMTKATNNRLHLGSVRVVLPLWWNNTDILTLEPANVNFSWDTADIRLQQAPTDNFGGYANHGPNTLQMGQCGVPGSHITIHTTFLDRDYTNTHYGPRGQVFMHEWAHYRWGVFEEYGHPKDPVYPVSYQRDDFTLPTACYEGELYGDFLTKSKEPCPGPHNDADNPCYFFPNSTSDPTTTRSSLMAHTHLSEGSFCTEATHDFWAPTPQNLICGQRSVWKVLDTHPDFMNPRALEQHKKSPAISISYQKAPLSRVFFLFSAPPAPESSKLKDCIRDFIEGSTEMFGAIELGMATFRTTTTGAAEIHNKLDFTSVTSFASIESYIPGPTSDPTFDTLLGEALLELLPTWNFYQPGTLLVTITWNSIVVKNAEEDLSTLLLDRRVKLLALDPTGLLADVLPLIPLLQNTGGNFYMKDTSTSDPMQILLNDLKGYLKLHNINDHKLMGVSRKEVQPFLPDAIELPVITVKNQKQINGYIRITPFDHIDSIEVTIDHPLTTKSILCDEPNNVLTLYCKSSTDGIFFYFRLQQAFIYEYQVKIKNKGTKSVVTETTWSTVDNVNTQQVSVAMWSSERELKANVQENNNLFLYCQVSHLSGVLQNLQVMAEVEFVVDAIESRQIITLTDNGDRDSRGVDVKARDTVWSGQLRGNWPAGTTFTVTTLAVNHNPEIFSPFHFDNTFKSNGNTAGSLAEGSSSVLPINPTEGDCCLSFSDEKSAQRSLVVNQVLRRPYSATIKNDIKEVPPRVSVVPQLDSLIIEKETIKVTLLLGGTEARQRKAAMYSYLVRYHEDFATLRDNFAEAREPLDVFQTPGDATSITVIISNKGLGNLYIAVANYNSSSGVESPPSTAVELSSLPTMATTETTTATPTTTTQTTATPTTTQTTATPPTTQTTATPTTKTTATPTTKTTPTPTTNAPSTSPENTETITPTTSSTEDPPSETDNTVTIIVVSVVCSVVVLGGAGGLFYYYRDKICRTTTTL